MSALEKTVRVLPESQTLILAGEAVPQRNPPSMMSRRPLTIVATPADETPLLMQETHESTGSAVISRSHDLASASSPADAYVRTQALSSRRTRTPLVDLYA
jgi:hypothetical protein